MRKRQILLVDRAPEFAAMLAAALRSHFTVEVADSLPRALAASRRPIHDAYVVDVNGSSDDPGMEFLQTLRRLADARPAIAISGSFDRELPARCYEAGAHGFVPKTRTLIRELRGLLPRLLPQSGGALRAMTARTDGIALPRTPFVFGGAKIDPVEMRAQFPRRTVELNPKEIGILHVFSRRRGELVRRAEILSEVWGPDAVPTSKSLDTYMTRLRSAYAKGGVNLRRFVAAKPKVGWRVAEEAQ